MVWIIRYLPKHHILKGGMLKFTRRKMQPFYKKLENNLWRTNISWFQDNFSIWHQISRSMFFPNSLKFIELLKLTLKSSFYSHKSPHGSHWLVQVGKNIIKDVLLNGGFRINIITKKPREILFLIPKPTLTNLKCYIKQLLNK